MDRIAKTLNRLSEPDRKRYRRMLQDIKRGRMTGYDVRKLSGHSDIFRVRKGPMRVIFRQPKTGRIEILTFERRSETTYRRK